MQGESEFGKSASGEGGGDMKQQLREGADQAAEQAKGRAEGMKSQVTGQAEKAAEALEAAAHEFESRGQESLGHMLEELSRNIGDLAKRVENKSLDELVREGGRIAGRNPLLFIAGSVAAGAMLSRFFKARATSGEPGQGGDWQREFGTQRTGEQDRATGYGGTPGSSGYGRSDTTESGRSYGRSSYAAATTPAAAMASTRRPNTIRCPGADSGGPTHLRAAATSHGPTTRRATEVTDERQPIIPGQWRRRAEPASPRDRP
jgi:hypothetical protein